MNTDSYPSELVTMSGHQWLATPNWTTNQREAYQYPRTPFSVSELRAPVSHFRISGN
jgi:hypothetical protein